MPAGELRVFSPQASLAKSSRRCDIRLADTVDDMYTFNQIDDHVITLIKHSASPHMARAKEIIDKIEHRGRHCLDCESGTTSLSLSLIEIYRYIGNTHVVFSVDFNKVTISREEQLPREK